MDHRVRDLDQIQERETDERGRRAGTVLLATAAVVGLTFAIGVVVGRAAEPSAPPADDPLAKLEPSTAASDHGKAAEPDAPEVEAADLSFPDALSEREERPEVIAALEAAAAEVAALSQPASDGADEAAAAAVEEPSAEADDAIEAVETESIVASVPAAVAGGSGSRSLPKAAKHDPLVAAAISQDGDTPNAPRGHDGKYTLQVISYDRSEPSHAFAEGLRAKGHRAFVMKADIPERGRYYRVRIGPFETRREVEAYRKKFEDEEHMNTFVVRMKEK